MKNNTTSHIQEIKTIINGNAETLDKHNFTECDYCQTQYGLNKIFCPNCGTKNNKK